MAEVQPSAPKKGYNIQSQYRVESCGGERFVCREVELRSKHRVTEVSVSGAINESGELTA